jgi:hypothetical protein
LHTVGEKHLPKPPVPVPYSIFDKAELENRAVGVASHIYAYIYVRQKSDASLSQELLTKEIEELQAKSAARRAAREKDLCADMSVDEVCVVPSIVVA